MSGAEFLRREHELAGSVEQLSGPGSAPVVLGVERVVDRDDDAPFGIRYLSLMQRDPALVMAHSAVAKALG
jgi:hypothetical protein